MSRPLFLAIECTDKGQHPWIVLGDLTLDGSAGLRANVGAAYGELADRRKSEAVWLDQLDPSKTEYRVHMKCPRCGRHVQWKHGRAVDVLTQLHAAGIKKLDVSLIP